MKDILSKIRNVVGDSHSGNIGAQREVLFGLIASLEKKLADAVADNVRLAKENSILNAKQQKLR